MSKPFKSERHAVLDATYPKRQPARVPRKRDSAAFGWISTLLMCGVMLALGMLLIGCGVRGAQPAAPDAPPVSYSMRTMLILASDPDANGVVCYLYSNVTMSCVQVQR